MSEIKFPKGPWVWGHTIAGPTHEPEHEWEASLYAPYEMPGKTFILKAGSIGDGMALPIRNLISAAPELYAALEELLIQTRQYGHEPEIAMAEAALAKARGEV